MNDDVWWMMMNGDDDGWIFFSTGFLFDKCFMVWLVECERVLFKPFDVVIGFFFKKKKKLLASLLHDYCDSMCVI